MEQELYDEIGRQELIAQIVELSKKGLLDVKWYQTGSEVECFIYRLEDMNAFMHWMAGGQRGNLRRLV